MQNDNWKPPATTLETTQGELMIPEGLKGHKTVLFFYPRNNTPGCTRQVHHFAAAMNQFRSLSCRVYGVNEAPIDSHQQFLSNEKVEVTLISDRDHVLADSLGIYGPQEVKGIEYTGNRRDLVILDENINLIMHEKQVSPDESHQMALSFLKKR